MNIEDLGYQSLPKVDIERKDYILHTKKHSGNVYAWNSLSLKDIPKGLDVCSFYVEDFRFKTMLSSTRKALFLLKRFEFKHIIQPDYSVYFDLPLIDQMYRCYIGKKIARAWSDNGFSIIPNLVLGSPELFYYAIYGIQKESTFAVQIQANDSTSTQDNIDEQTIKGAMEILKPKTVLVYGTEDRLKKLHLENIPEIIRIKTQIEHLRNM